MTDLLYVVLATVCVVLVRALVRFCDRIVTRDS